PSSRTLPKPMNASTSLSCVAIATGIAAVLISLRTPGPPSQEEIDAAVSTAIARREKEWVRRHAPDFKVMYSELEALESGDEAWEPETLEDLIAPLIGIVSEMAEQ